MKYRQGALIKELANLPPINTLKNIISPREKIYLVGGSVRNLLLGRKIKDFDFIINKSPLFIVRKLAKTLKGNFFKFKDCHYRIIYKENRIIKNIDFSKFKENNLLKNLKARDFTINALALEINNPCLIDPCNGVKDLTKKTLRVISPSSFTADPLRLLRTIRLSAQLKFKIEDETKKLLIKFASLIKKTSKERILNELCLILKNKNSFYFIKQLQEIGLLNYIIPEFAFFHEPLFKSKNIWWHSLNSLKELEGILSNLPLYFPEYHRRMKNYLRKNQAINRNNLILLKLATLLHDIGKPLTISLDKRGKICYVSHQEVGKILALNIFKHLTLSSREIEHLTQLIKHHMTIGYFSNCPNLTLKSLWRFYKKVSPNLINISLLSLADSKEAYPKNPNINFFKQQELVNNLLHRYFSKDKTSYPKSLIKGDDLIKCFNLSPGPVFKIILSEVIEAYVEGKIKNKKEALKYIKLKYNLPQRSLSVKE